MEGEDRNIDEAESPSGPSSIRIPPITSIHQQITETTPFITDRNRHSAMSPLTSPAETMQYHRRHSLHPPPELVQRYINQLIYGCHRRSCTNPFCASNPAFSLTTTQEITSSAALLARSGTQHLCTAIATSPPEASVQLERYKNEPERKEFHFLTCDSFKRLVDECVSRGSSDWTIIMQIIYGVFSDIERLNGSFRTNAKLQHSQVHLFYDIIMHQCPHAIINCLMTAIACAFDKLRLNPDLMHDKGSVESIVLIMCCPALFDASFHSTVVSRLADFFANSLSQVQQLDVGHRWLDYKLEGIRDELKSKMTKKKVLPAAFGLQKNDPWTACYLDLPEEVRSRLKVEMASMVGVFQHFIALRIDSMATQLGISFAPNTDEAVTNATKALALFERLNNDTALLHYSEFYNYAINENLEIKDDFPHWKAKKGFSFCNYPFILNAAIKSDILKVESMVQMRHELQDSFFRAMFIGVNSPYLVLEIRRDNIIRDALYQLESKKSQDLRKQLKIQFVGEEAVDEGGVQKEFFQLAVREIFDEKYSIFRKIEESHTYWFSHQPSFDEQFLEEIRLVGLLLGLAIYNGVILDIHFPQVLYKKLMGKPVTLEDLTMLEPVLGRSLLTLLDFDGDVESAFSRSFQIDIQIFGETQTIDLVENGADKPLTNENREEFVRLYVDFLLNKSVENAFNAFKRGFDLICSESAISLFRPEELELLICGDSDLDFEALKNNTSYDGGYSLETPVIKYFWDTVLQFDDEKKKRLLFFATGTDRVPIGGLAKLTFVIAKNGTDSDRLPSSHTCFNVLLLPEYSSAEKLKERLLTAIQNSEGFGMI